MPLDKQIYHKFDGLLKNIKKTINSNAIKSKLQQAHWKRFVTGILG
jgi:hypothetical protein